MQATRPGPAIGMYATRLMIVVGVVFSLCLPILFFTMQGKPQPMYDCSPLADGQLVCPSHRIVWLYPLLVSDRTVKLTL